MNYNLFCFSLELSPNYLHSVCLLYLSFENRGGEGHLDPHLVEI